MYWTLDLNGKRYIVKHSGGGQYVHWAGHSKGFEQKPLALSFIASSQPSATVSTNRVGILPDRSAVPIKRKRSIPTDGSTSSDSPDTSDSENSEDNVQRRQTSGLTGLMSDTGPRDELWHVDDDESNQNNSETNASEQPAALRTAPAKRRKIGVSSPEIDHSHRVSPPRSRRSNPRLSYKEHKPDSMHAINSMYSTSKDPVKDREEKRKRSATARIEKALDRKFDQIFTPWAGDDQDVSRNTLGFILKVITLMEENSPQKISRTLNKAVNGGDGKRQPAGGNKPIKPYFTELVASLQSSKAASTNGGGHEIPASPSKSNHGQHNPRSQQKPEASSADPALPDPRPIPPDGDRSHVDRDPRPIPADGDRNQVDRDPDSDTAPSVTLPRRKQANTKLIVRVAPSLDYLPLKLSECITPEAFYGKVFGAWNINRESVAKMTVTFTWMESNDPMRTMVMNSQVEGCFDHLVEQVDEASVWVEAPEGRGKCVLDVEIVLKEGSARG